MHSKCNIRVDNCPSKRSDEKARCDQYNISKCLDVRRYGATYLVTDSRNGEELVMKDINMEGVCKTKQEEAHQELKALQELKHPNIWTHRESFLNEKKLCIIMDYCNCENLSDRIKEKKEVNECFTEREILDIFCQICLDFKSCIANVSYIMI
eukprot:TRINITY_DN1956_c0_g1_i1.p1 TRINITY_DN1956_c0_g1~~TRINITY_DN1956_c0_g1_i1.p1  ORF type:complete len:153 (+),score=22.64 TRINITY_DN1956_c0_g1_i1:62-520(+)